MRQNKAYWGDWVHVSDENGAHVGAGVVKGCPIMPEDDTYCIDPTYGDGFAHADLTNVLEEQITLIEQGWHQQWEKRVFRR
jgi:hypothetical protein